MQLNEVDILPASWVSIALEEMIYCQTHDVDHDRTYVAKQNLTKALRDYAQEIVRACRHEPRK